MLRRRGGALSEHEKQKRIELADGVGDAIDALVSRAAEVGEMIWAGMRSSSYRRTFLIPSCPLPNLPRH
jgi:hypothetical protein